LIAETKNTVVGALTRSEVLEVQPPDLAFANFYRQTDLLAGLLYYVELNIVFRTGVELEIEKVVEIASVDPGDSITRPESDLLTQRKRIHASHNYPFVLLRSIDRIDCLEKLGVHKQESIAEAGRTLPEREEGVSGKELCVRRGSRV